MYESRSHRLSTQATFEYPGLEVDPLLPTCGAAIRVLGYVYEYLFQLQAHRLRQRVAELAST